jgi:hypothetical protein
VEVGKNDAFFEHEYALDQACESCGTFEMSNLPIELAFIQCWMRSIIDHLHST